MSTYVRLGELRPPLQKHCRAARQAAKKCLHENADEALATATTQDQSQSCAKSARAVTQCEVAVTRAYRQINMGGCPRAMHAVTLCEQEWCGGGGPTAGMPVEVSPCQSECATVRSKLNDCVQQHVAAAFTRQGLERDGTLVQES
jgi:hypothetical protein